MRTVSRCRPNTREASRTLMPSTITARRTRRYTSTVYIHGTIRRVDYCPMNGGERPNLQPPFVSDYPPARNNLPPPFVNLAALGQNELYSWSGEVKPVPESTSRPRAGRVPEVKSRIVPLLISMARTTVPVDLEEFLEIGLRVKLDLHAPPEPGVLRITDFVRKGRLLVFH